MVYLLDLIYGLAKLDINDSANEFGYGWFYLFFFFNLNRFLNMAFLAFNAIMVVVFSSKIKNLTMMRVIHFLSTCYIFLLTFPYFFTNVSFEKLFCDYQFDAGIRHDSQFLWPSIFGNVNRTIDVIHSVDRF